jgi:hypothetical protein
MIKTLVREHHWSPNTIGDLFVDTVDYKGLEFWYNDIVETTKELETKNPKK